MKIMICGSMAFAKEMVETQKQLQEMGHEVHIPPDFEAHLEDDNLVDDLEGNIQHVQETDIMRRCFEYVAWSNAILVLNYPRKGLAGYIGTSALMEIGLAYYLKKKIFLLYPIPHYNEVRWAHEITIIDPIIIDGDLSRVT